MIDTKQAKKDQRIMVAAAFEAEITHLRARVEKADELAMTLADLRLLVEGQARDEGLWFVAHTAPEAYLQQELRRLHAAVEALEEDDDR